MIVVFFFAPVVDYIISGFGAFLPAGFETGAIVFALVLTAWSFAVQVLALLLLQAFVSTSSMNNKITPIFRPNI